MRHTLIIIASIVLSTQGIALADAITSTTDVVLPATPPPEAEVNTCETVKLPECRQAVASCEKDQELLLNALKQCYGMGDIDPKVIIKDLRDGKTPEKPVLPPKPPAHPRTKPPTASKPPTATLTLVTHTTRFTSHAGCPVGGATVTAVVGQKVVYSTFICDGAPGLQGPKGDSGPQGIPGKSSTDAGRDGQDGQDGTKIGIGMAFSADVVSPASKASTFSSGVGLNLRVQHGTYEWSAAALWSPGIDHGSVFKTDLTKYVWKGLGITAGAELIYAGVNDHNIAHQQFVIGTIGPSYQILRKAGWKAEVEAHVSYGATGAGGAWTSASGVGASGGLGYEF